MAETELMPDLRLVSLERSRFHELPENRRTEKLVRRIRSEATLRHPPIVAELDNGDFLLLDGANRISAFRMMELSHAPVQVVHYGDKRIQLKGWHHLLLQGRSLDLHRIYAGLPGVTLRQVQQDALAELLELRQVFAVLVDEAATCWALLPAPSERAATPIEIHRRIDVLKQIIAAYEGRSVLERVKLADYSLLPVVLPALRKEELVQLVSEDVLIPTGISRHLIPGRALGLNLSLDFLTDSRTEEQKISHFNAFLEELKMQGRVRFYEESVFIMNE